MLIAIRCEISPPGVIDITPQGAVNHTSTPVNGVIRNGRILNDT